MVLYFIPRSNKDLRFVDRDGVISVSPGTMDSGEFDKILPSLHEKAANYRCAQQTLPNPNLRRHLATAS